MRDNLRSDEKLLLVKIAAMIESGLMQYDSPMSGYNYRYKRIFDGGVFDGWVTFKISGGEFYRLRTHKILRHKPYSSAFLLTGKGKKIVKGIIRNG